MLILYDGTTSVCAIKVRLTLVEKGLSFESRKLDLRKGDQFSQTYLKINPNAVVPTLIDGKDTIIESSVIMQYLEDLAPDPTLLPESPVNRAQMRLWLKRIDDPLHPSTGILTHATAFRPIFLKKSRKEQKEHFNRMPDQGRRLRQETVYKEGLNAPIVENAIFVFNKFMEDAELALRKNSYLAGPNYSLADAAATPYLNRLNDLKLLHIWKAKKPHVFDWFKQIKERPSFKSAITGFLTKKDIDQFANVDDSGADKAKILLKIS